MTVGSKVVSIGNSNAIRISKLIMEALSLKTGDPISITLTENSELLIRKQNSAKEYPSIAELFSEYSGDYLPCEFGGGRMGREEI